eukprot:7058050-Alexandrium_andersonii.AAC.1
MGPWLANAARPPPNNQSAIQLPQRGRSRRKNQLGRGDDHTGTAAAAGVATLLLLLCAPDSGRSGGRSLARGG